MFWLVAVCAECHHWNSKEYWEGYRAGMIYGYLTGRYLNTSIKAIEWRPTTETIKPSLLPVPPVAEKPHFPPRLR